MAAPRAMADRGDMLIPFISVSAIGLFVALRRQRAGIALGPLTGAGLVGAWVGFLLGSLAGGIVEVLFFGGFWSLVGGHIGALAAARIAVTTRSRAALPQRV